MNRVQLVNRLKRSHKLENLHYHYGTAKLYHSLFNFTDKTKKYFIIFQPARVFVKVVEKNFVV